MRRVLVIGLATLLAGCAGGSLAPSRSLSGTAGGIGWEVRDVVRNPTQGGWDYTIVLTERAGIPVHFQRQEIGTLTTDTTARPLEGAPFSRSLDRHDKLRLRLWSAGPAGDESTFMVWRRYLGEDPAGRSVQVDVRFYPARLQDPSGPAAARGAPAKPSRSAADRLKELDALRQQQLISEEEYQAGRKRILEGL